MKSVWMVSVAAAVLCVVLSGSAGAQQAATAYKESGCELQVYDIKAYFERTPIYNFARVPGTDEKAMQMHKDSSAGGGGLFAAEYTDPNYQRDESQKAEELKSLIQRLVRPKEAWEESGGRSVIDFVTTRGLMFVYTTPDGHQQIKAIVESILPGQKKSLAIDIQIVELDKAALGDVPPAGFVAASAEQKAALKKAVKTVHQTTSLTGADGQVLSNEKGTAKSYVSDTEPVVTEQTVSSDPSIDILTDGFSVQIQAILSSDAKRATLDFRLLQTRAIATRAAKVQAATSYQTTESTFELPTVVSDSQAGTVSLPLGSPMVVAGGTVPAGLLTGNAEDKGTTEVYYIATVRLVDVPPAEKQADKK